jgi:hypothetical protein
MLLIGDPESSIDGDKPDPQQVADNCLNAMRLMRLESRIRDLDVEIAAAEGLGESEHRDQLVSAKMNLSRQRNALLQNQKAKS